MSQSCIDLSSSHKSMVYDDKQGKRYKLMKKQGISVRNTIVLLNSDIIRKSADQNENADNRLRQNWIQNIATVFRIKSENLAMTLGHGLSYLHFKQQLDLTKFLFIKGMEKKRITYDQKSSGHSRMLSLSQILPCIGDVDYMEQGSPAQIMKDYKVTIDQNSSKHIVPVNIQNQSFQFPTCRLLITNSITQHKSRLSCRFTSLLPDISNLESILHLVFYPFVTLMPDKKRTRYYSIFLKKRVKLRINYELTDEQINEANQIREI